MFDRTAPSPSPVKAVLFDFDGTLIDTESPSLRAWREVYAEHGLELTLERWAQRVGTIGAFDPLADLEEQLRRKLDREAIDDARRRRRDELNALERLRPGTAAYLADARRLGLAVGIVSSSDRDWVLEHLARVGCGDGWACVVCADFDPERAKPRPFLYRAALEQLAVDASEAIAIEDSPNGVAAAKAAGIFCVAVPNAVTSSLDLAGADLRVESLEEVPLPELLERVAGTGAP